MLSHGQMEAPTGPLLSAWFDANGAAGAVSSLVTPAVRAAISRATALPMRPLRGPDTPAYMLEQLPPAPTIRHAGWPINVPCSGKDRFHQFWKAMKRINVHLQVTLRYGVPGAVARHVSLRCRRIKYEALPSDLLPSVSSLRPLVPCVTHHPRTRGLSCSCMLYLSRGYRSDHVLSTCSASSPGFLPYGFCRLSGLRTNRCEQGI
jgi:hypothetical protein